MPIPAVRGSAASLAAIIFSTSFSPLAAIGGRRPAGSRLRAKTFGMAVMTWKCFECGSRLRKRRTSVECVQNPARAAKISAPADQPWRIPAHSEPTGAGHGDHEPPYCSPASGAVIVAMTSHWCGVAPLVAASQSAILCDASTSDAPS